MNAEVQRLIELLRTAMRILGFRNRDIERRLGVSPSYLSRVYSGGIEMKAEYLIAIPKAMGLEPAEFFEIAYPRKLEPSRAAEQLHKAIQELTPPPPEAPSGGFTAEQMQQLREMMREMLAGG